MSDSWGGSAGTYVGSAALATSIAVGFYNHQQTKSLNDKLNEHGGYISALINKINNLQNIDVGVKGVAESLKELKETVIQLDQSYKNLNQDIGNINNSMNHLITQVQIDHSNMAQQAKSIESILQIMQNLDAVNKDQLYIPNYKSGKNNNRNNYNNNSQQMPPQMAAQMPAQMYSQAPLQMPAQIPARVPARMPAQIQPSNNYGNSHYEQKHISGQSNNRRIQSPNQRQVKIKHTPIMHSNSNNYDDEDELDMLRN